MSLISKTRKGVRLLRNYVTHPAPRNLYSVVFAITYLCNSRCTICNIWEKYVQNPEEAKNELNIHDIRKIFQSSQYLKRVRSLLVCGGEPFLKKDFVDIVLFFYELNPEINITVATNGFNSVQIYDKLSEISRALQKIGLNNSSPYIGIALDGMEETHNRIRGKKDAFRSVLRTFESVKKIKGIRAGIAFTMTPENYHEFLGVYDLSKKLDVNFGFRFAHVSGHYYGNEEKRFVWTENDIKEIREILCHTRHLDNSSKGSLGYRLIDSTRFFMEHYLLYQYQPKRYFNCYSGTHSCFLDPYGSVYPCIMLDKSIGNIRDYENYDFDRLWLSQGAKQIREYIARWKCHCFSKCDVPASLQREIRVISWNMKSILSIRRMRP